jgi:predicted SnoaL-like aldol condensation-catalyzing enzyme/quinol monooxygenase YgiN
MVTVGFLVRLEAVPDRAEELEARLRAAIPAIEQEEGTTAWFAVRLGPSSYAVFDVFPDEASQQVHFEAGSVRLAQSAELFAQPPSIVATEVIAAKLPRSDRVSFAGASRRDAQEANKQAVLAFYDAAINRRDFDAASRYLGARYVQHNPLIGDDIDGFRAFLLDLQHRFPKLRAEVKRVFADGDFVIVHTHGIREPGQRGSAIIDIFRLEHGKIVEHWDAIQSIPDEARHANTMF